MRVRITQTSEIDSVLEKIALFLEEASEPLNKVNDLLSGSKILLKNRPDSSTYVSEIMEDMRKSLGHVDEIISDAQSVLLGYDQAMKKLDSQPSKPMEPSMSPSKPSPPLSEPSEAE